VNFEPRQVGSRSEPEQIRLQNPGTARFSAGYVISGNEGAHFQVSGCDGGRGSFFFGKDCTLYVSFQPNSGGSHDAVINIRETSDGGDPVNDAVLATIGLNGRGLAAEVEVTPNQLDFREPNPPRQRVIVRNSGEVAVRVYGADVTGPDANRFRANADECRTQPIASGRQCAINVSHSVSSSPRHTARMVVKHSAGQSAEISLYWEPPPVPAFSADPQSIDFGTLDVGEPSVQRVTVTNTGNAAATNIGAGFLGGNAGSFRVVENGCQGAAIPPEGRCTIAVAFEPTREGSLSSTLVIATANLSATVSVSVNGQGRRVIIGR
jgi:hypothetical protein